MSEVKKYATQEEYLKEVFADEEFTRRVFDMDTPEEVQAALKEKDIDISIEGVMKLRDIIEAAMEKGGELSVDELDEVAGGEAVLALTIGGAVFSGGGPIGFAVLATAVIGAGLFFGIKDAIRRRW